jgi:hypothetical protein
MTRAVVTFGAASVLALLLSCMGGNSPNTSYEEILLEIANDIEQLKQEYPKFELFSVFNQFDVARLPTTWFGGR